MRRCVVCGSRFARLLAACPRCGTEGMVGVETAGEAEVLMDVVWIQKLSRRHVDLGAELYGCGKYDEAEAEYQKAISLNPQNVYAHGNMGLIFLKRNQPEKAIEWFERALELNPHYEGGVEILAKAKALCELKKQK